VTLRELRAAFRSMFHPTQDWFEGEQFFDAPLGPERALPTAVANHDTHETVGERCEHATYSAADLARLYIRFPHDTLWKRYLWTTDVDQHGQHVYVGVSARGFEIHRHLELSHRWGTPWL